MWSNYILQVIKEEYLNDAGKELEHLLGMLEHQGHSVTGQWKSGLM
jgi:hypothetical protein